MSDKPIVVAPGMMLGVYRMMELIGKGGFSEVWSAWDTRLQRMIAIKIIPNETVPASSLTHFNREATIITRLEHPHILPLYDFGEEKTHHFLVMRYVTGGSLAKRFQPGAMPPTNILQVMTPIASALDYVHSRQIVHRDIKPGNILLDAQGSPYLTDFGLAKILSDETEQLNSGSGTLHFMSPEQLNSEAVSIQSDQYSFGILLFQLFTGSLPLNGDYVFSLRQSNLGEILPDVTSLNPNLPTSLNDPLRRLTALHPSERPESIVSAMAEIASLFKDMANVSLTVSASPPMALDSQAYRKHEALSLLEKSLPVWRTGKFTLSLTHFVLLDLFLDELPELITPDVRSLMLRGALEDGQKIDKWWERCTDEERRRVCWSALGETSDTIQLKTLHLMAKVKWKEGIPPEVIIRIGQRLMPISDFTPLVLEILEHALPIRKEWRSEKDEFAEIDDNLGQLAQSEHPLAKRAALLIGKARRTKAATGLSNGVGQSEALLNIFESAGSLPKSYSTTALTQVRVRLGVRQLTRQRLLVFRKYLWAVAGGTMSVALMVYFIYRKLTLVDTVPLLNAAGQGIMFGTLYGTGIWLARHISTQLQVVPRWVRVVLGTLSGGLIIALTFWLYQKLVYDDAIEPMVSVPAGLLYSFGFTISAGLPVWMQVTAGSAGFAGAFLLPWIAYLQTDYTLRPPFFFDENAPELALLMVFTAGLLLSFLVTAYLWLPPLIRRFSQRAAGS